MKIVIDGLTEKMIDALCRKWGYPGMVLETRTIEEIENEDGSVTPSKDITQKVPNPQSKKDFVKEYVISFVTNEYRLIVRDKERLESEQKAENQVKKEVKLK